MAEEIELKTEDCLCLECATAKRSKRGVCPSCGQRKRLIPVVKE